MENPDLRMAMGMRSNQKGVRIRRVDPTAPESSVLQPSDVILSFDGVDIANDGTGVFFFHFLQLFPIYVKLNIYFPMLLWGHILWEQGFSMGTKNLQY